MCIYIYIYICPPFLYVYMCIYIFDLYILFFHIILLLTAQVVLNAFSIGCHTLHIRPFHELHFVMLTMRFNQSNKFNQFENFR
nr:MAG TPA: hypothetical protein [Caudoviricetes sp.]